MNPKLLQAAMLIGMFGGTPQKRTVRVVQNPQFTQEVMAKNSVIAGKELQLVERNSQGDCLCIGKYAEGGEFMVDVDHRDIQP